MPLAGGVHASQTEWPPGMPAWSGSLESAVAPTLLPEPVPEEEVIEPPSPPAKESPVWGVILIVVGILFLLDQWDLLDFGYLFERFWPALIIVLGIQMLLRARRQNSQSAIS